MLPITKKIFACGAPFFSNFNILYAMGVISIKPDLV